VKWLPFFQQIPPGQAAELWEDEIGVTTYNVYMMLHYHKKKGHLPQNYYCVGRSIQGRKVIYVANGAKSA
jgi:hypothetical protein